MKSNLDINKRVTKQAQEEKPLHHKLIILEGILWYFDMKKEIQGMLTPS